MYRSLPPSSSATGGASAALGLGLAICRSIVTAHDGTLTVERNVGFGMTFTVTLGARAEPAA